jgi:hypothetical protein
MLIMTRNLSRQQNLDEWEHNAFQLMIQSPHEFRNMLYGIHIMDLRPTRRPIITSMFLNLDGMMQSADWQTLIC